MTPLRSLLRRFRRHDGGSAAIEMALVSALLSSALVNVAELCRYGYTVMQVSTASQAGASAALAECDTAHLPAVANCPGLTVAVTRAVESTPLGDKIAVQGQFTEGYYCLNAANELTYVQSAALKPQDCSAANNPTATPALYFGVIVTYTYEPLFPNLTLVQALPKQMTRSAWMRMT